MAGEEHLATAFLRQRVSEGDVHYGGGLVNGAWVLGLFGDLATEICIRCDGDEGLLRAYEQVEFLAPIHAGDFIEASGRLSEKGKTSRRIELEARRVIVPRPNLGDSSAEVLGQPILVARATAVAVVPVDRQRVPHGASRPEKQGGEGR